MRLLVAIRDVLWGAPTVLVLSGAGLYFTARLGFFNPKRLWEAFTKTFLAPRKKGKGGNLSSLSALATALGGTVGVGSIGGVALALKLGGAGSIFWMWLCAFFGTGLKYAEVAIAHSRRIKTERGYSGGAMYCLRDMGNNGLAYAFAVLVALGAAAGGSVVQASALSGAIGTLIGGKALRAAAVGLLVLAVVSGGRRLISGFNTLALPLASISFVLLTCVVLLKNLSALPGAFERIVTEALGLRPALGGVGLTAMLGVGCTRGTFSNEAGMGSSPISYCAGSEESSHIQGLWGVGEVVIDSFVISTLTALCLLCTGCESVLEVFGQSYGEAGESFYFAAISVFAFAAIVSWCFYGEEAVRFLFPRRGAWLGIFRLAVALGAFGGALMREGDSFAAADIFGALMLVPNLYLLCKSRSDIIELAKQKR